MRVEPLPRAHAPLDGLPSVLLRALSLIIIVGLIVAAIQVLPTAEENPASTAAVSSTAQVTQRTAPQNTRGQAQGAKPRVVYAGPIVSSAAMPQRTPTSQDTRSAPAEAADPVAVEGQPRSAEAPVARTALLPEPEVVASEVTSVSPSAIAGFAAAPAATDATDIAALDEKTESPENSADGLVDINTATLEELNGLEGAGRIGRAIIRRRPYASPEDLLKKRVLNRTTFNRIKDQITAQ
jgi:DNA uptake protein ComE-like DNA-binding protein